MLHSLPYFSNTPGKIKGKETQPYLTLNYVFVFMIVCRAWGIWGNQETDWDGRKSGCSSKNVEQVNIAVFLVWAVITLI